jgi:ABC-2 type transport system ATP-binding protein
VGTPDYLKSKIHGDVILTIKTDLTMDPSGIKDQITNFESVRTVKFAEGIFSISLKHRNEIASIVDVFGSHVVAVNTQEPTLNDVFIHSVK